MSPLQPTKSQLINRPLNRGNSRGKNIERCVIQNFRAFQTCDLFEMMSGLFL